MTIFHMITRMGPGLGLMLLPGLAVANGTDSNLALIGAVERYIGAAPAAALRQAAGAGGHSPLAMFMGADIVVKSVMLGLALASVLGWAVWIGKLGQLWLANGSLRRGYRLLARAGSLGAEPVGAYRGALRAMMRAAQAERDISQGLHKDGIKERVNSELQRIEAGAARAMQSGAMVLGSIGATAPFIGLFGTVWGIMNSFVGIAESGTTSLSVVAPGIAEALLATAIGLVAAIPAVLMYNHVSRAVTGHRARLGDAAALVERCLSRDLDRAEQAPRDLIPARLAAE